VPVAKASFEQVLAGISNFPSRNNLAFGPLLSENMSGHVDMHASLQLVQIRAKSFGNELLMLQVPLNNSDVFEGEDHPGYR
jgi:hypothetical protein